jgi:nucleoside-diphosphate-sugar epimerase
MPTALITGGSGFFGGVLKRHLLEEGWDCISLDLHPDDASHPRLRSIQGDIRDRATVEAACAQGTVDVVFHCAAMLAHAVKDEDLLWTSNVEGTRVLADVASAQGVGSLVFISSNCLWGSNLGHPVREDEPPEPVEIYGRSKWEAEKVLASYADRLRVAVLRSPTIVDAGRLGLLAILFEFIADGKRVWVVGRGSNRYQFVYAPDLADACVRAAAHPTGGLFHIGSDEVGTLREVYEFVIAKAGTDARVAQLPRRPTQLALQLADKLHVSPLGPYHYRMICEDFVFDTSKAKAELGWVPTMTNGEMLWKAYEFFVEHRTQSQSPADVSAHRQASKMGVIKLLKWVS